MGSGGTDRRAPGVRAVGVAGTDRPRSPEVRGGRGVRGGLWDPALPQSCPVPRARLWWPHQEGGIASRLHLGVGRFVQCHTPGPRDLSASIYPTHEQTPVTNPRGGCVQPLPRPPTSHGLQGRADCYPEGQWLVTSCGGSPGTELVTRTHRPGRARRSWGSGTESSRPLARKPAPPRV